MRCKPYWDVCPKLRKTLFKTNRPGYLDLAVEKAAIKSTIYEHPEFAAFIAGMNAHFAAWRQKSATDARQLQAGCHPKEVIADLAEDLLAHYADKPLIDHYDIYQHLMDYWAETMQDDCYLIAADGWKAETYRIIEKRQEGQGKGQGLDLRPGAQGAHRRPLLRQGAGGHRQARGRIGKRHRRISELEEEHGGEEGAFAELDKVNKANVTARLKEIKGDKEAKDEAAVLNEWLKLANEEADLKKRLKEAEAELDANGLREISQAHRGGNQDAGRGRQMARRARRGHPRRDGPHQPGTYPASEGTGRTL